MRNPLGEPIFEGESRIAYLASMTTARPSVEVNRIAVRLSFVPERYRIKNGRLATVRVASAVRATLPS